MRKNKSLKASIRLRLILPLIVFIACETLLSYFVTLHYVDKTYDRWLLDSANSLAQEIKVNKPDVLVDLPKSSMEIVKWDDEDETYFKIYSLKRGLLVGDVILPELKHSSGQPNPVFLEAKVNREPVRIVSMRVERPDLDDTFFVVVAETLNKRQAMMADILLADLVPQLVMVILVSYLLMTGLTRGLKPLNVLTQEIAKRSPRDLSPIAETYVLTEVKTLTDTINDLIARLSASVAGQQRFVANAAHQLRTPLAGLVLQAERALRESGPEMVKPALEQMQSSAKRLAHTVNQLLLLAKSETPESRQNMKPVDLSLLAKSVCLEMAPKALQAGINIVFDCRDRPIWVPGNEQLLGELLVNLFDNAIVYGSYGGHVAVRLTKDPSPSLTVEDDGPGIAPAEVERIFERFYRIPGSAGEGSGLGLAIVKEIADLHHAELALSRINAAGGTRVKVVF